MSVIIKNALIIDPNSHHNNKRRDIYIENGEIIKIKENININAKNIINETDICVSPGLFDIRADFGEPGFENKETINTGLNAAAKGGFTGVAITPNTNPPISNSNVVDYIKNKALNNLVNIYPIGSVSKSLKGKEMSEMYDMKQAGAIAFSDNKNSIENTKLLSMALLYTKSFDGLIISFANDKSISRNGQINEGVVSTNLGLEGIPHLAEELQISRDLYLAEYNNSPIHFASISSKKTIELINQAKQKNIKVTSDVAAHQLIFTDSSAKDFDSNFKVIPPFRLQEDIEAIIEGLKDGNINAICSDHTPLEIEDKEKEFDLAKFGIINIETAFPSMLTYLAPKTGLELIINKMAIEPRNILKLPIPTIKENNKCNIVVYSPTKKWTYNKKDIVSKSKNSPYINTEFTGKVIAVLNNNKATIF